jgi:hypothetical protein
MATSSSTRRFLVSERETIPPSALRCARLFKELAVPDGYRPRGSTSATRTSHPELNRDDAAPTDRRTHPGPLTMPLLHPANQTDEAPHLVTQ